MPPGFTENQVEQGMVDAVAVDRRAVVTKAHPALANSGSAMWRLFRFVTARLFAEELWGL
jgi:hypothetical protein